MTDVLRGLVVAAIGEQYELEDELGRGGMSVVYRARDRRLGRRVAIKVLPPDLAHDPAIRTRFAREAHTSAQLAHPRIVPIHDVGDRDGISYLVMGYVAGGSLARLLAREPRLPAEEARRLLHEIADALAYAHSRGVIHRDIKPDNILLDADGERAMVTDFGIARAMEAGQRVTQTGVAVGTPAYMSPEQATGERQVDGRSDIYSLGVLGYQMVTGRLPFVARNSMALLMKHVAEAPRPVAELRPDTPAALREVIERALRKAPEDRWQTAESLRDALAPGASPASAWRESREPLRYLSPGRGSRAAALPAAAAMAAEAGPAPGSLVMVPGHLAALTPEQHADLRLWNGRAHLFDRIKAARGYTLLTIGAWFGSFAGFALGVEEGIPPLVLAPIIPAIMSVKWWKRARSLRRAGVKLRRVLFMPLARWVIPAPPAPAGDKALLKLAGAEALHGPHGAVIRRAAAERDAILELVNGLPKADRALLPDVAPTANALVDRVAHLAGALGRLEQSLDPKLAGRLDQQIAEAEREGATPDGERRMSLLRRQRETLQGLLQRRAELARQIDSATLALGNLRLDLVKLRSSGVQASLADVSTATQEARALSREIGDVLEAAAEMKRL